MTRPIRKTHPPQKDPPSVASSDSESIFDSTFNDDALQSDFSTSPDTSAARHLTYYSAATYAAASFFSDGYIPIPKANCLAF